MVAKNRAGYVSEQRRLALGARRSVRRAGAHVSSGPVLILMPTCCAPRGLRRGGGSTVYDEAPPARHASRVGDDDDPFTITITIPRRVCLTLLI